MNGEAEKLEVIKLIIETDDKDIIMEVKSLFKNRDKISGKKDGLEEFYNGFRGGVRHVKSSLNGKTELKTQNAWLHKL